MSEVRIKLTSTLVQIIDGKRRQHSHKIHCTICGCAYFTQIKRKSRYVQITCDGCGRHFSIGLLILERLSEL